MAQEKQFIRQTRRPIYLLEGAGLPRPSGSRAIAADVHQPESAIGRNAVSVIIANSTTFSIRRRNLLLAAVAILVFFLVAVGTNGFRVGDLGVSLWAVFGILFGVAFIRQLRLERRILTNPNEASATVLQLRYAGHRRGFSIKYEFVAGDGMIRSGQEDRM